MKNTTMIKTLQRLTKMSNTTDITSYVCTKLIKNITNVPLRHFRILSLASQLLSLFQQDFLKYDWLEDISLLLKQLLCTVDTGAVNSEKV